MVPNIKSFEIMPRHWNSLLTFRSMFVSFTFACWQVSNGYMQYAQCQLYMISFFILSTCSACKCTVNWLLYFNGQDQPSAETNQEDSEKNTLKIKAVGAIAFVVVASAFLVVLFFFMSSSFVFALNVIFSLAGSQVLNTLKSCPCKKSIILSITNILFWIC